MRENSSFVSWLWQMSLFVHTIRKVKFLSKNSILTKPQHFHEFFTKFFLTIFLVKSKLSTAKKSKTTTFSRVFHQKNRQFFREIKVEFSDKKWRFRTVCKSVIAIPFHKCRNGLCGSWSNHKWAPHHWPLNLAHRFYYCFSGKRPQFFVHFWLFPLQTDSHSHLGIQNKAKRNFCPNAKDFFAAKKP